MPEPTIHIVEDDASVRESLLLLLQLKGLRATGFESADAFLAAVRPDWSGCLLVDLRMPGTTGLELQAILREREILMPIIIITAHGDVAAARRAFISGAIDFLEKPLDESALLMAVDKALGQDRARRESDALAAGRDARIARLSRREREVLWLAGDGLEYEAAARVADAAHRLSQLRLAQGDPGGAMDAARAGLRLAFDDELPWRDLLIAAHATGQEHLLRAAVAELCARTALDEVLPRMAPETEALIDELLPSWRSSVG